MSLNSMRAARSTASVALIRYATVRGKNPDRLICVFEGLEDQPYYETAFHRTLGHADFAPLIAKGKDQVLELRSILQKQEPFDQSIRFFVDRDFDYLKEHNGGDDIYVTEGYSIENHLVSKSILLSLLGSEYKCTADGDFEALEKSDKLFDELLESFFRIMRPVNLAIYHARKNGLKLKNIEDRVTEYISLSLTEVVKTENDIFQLIGWPEGESQDTSSAEETFSNIDPLMGWRGKFIFALFIKMLHLLKNDRTSERPNIFQKKTGVRFDPSGEVVRSFASIAAIPQSLSHFIHSCGLPTRTAVVS
ncbi:Protein of unknown function [Pseudomonas guariconensis]|uniref:DUF4435 domain-containing protein n=1 Tax=Pseudomonas guariconensis TaxID=1288410 RepID=UPI0008883DCC|nr:DUF4435 domain-containing protein [Pseudomonas guariconensis]SDE24624.1 Protein of unknown function [Pseudomonas guariconensis]